MLNSIRRCLHELFAFVGFAIDLDVGWPGGPIRVPSRLKLNCRVTEPLASVEGGTQQFCRAAPTSVIVFRGSAAKLPANGVNTPAASRKPNVVFIV